jgi:hypothetical protein
MLAGDEHDPTMKARTMEPSEFESTPRKLTDQDVSQIAAAQEELRRSVLAKVSKLAEQGGEDSSRAFRQHIAALRSANLDQNNTVVEHADLVWEALHDPALIAEVVSTAYGESLKNLRTGSLGEINKALLRAAAKGGPITEVPRDSSIQPKEFFEYWVKTGRRFYDTFDTSSHGDTTHMIQDLAVDLLFKRRGIKMSSAEFRMALGRVHDPNDPEAGRMLWQNMYDASDNGINHPEWLMYEIREARVGSRQVLKGELK